MSNAEPLDATAYSSLFLSTFALEAARNRQSKYLHDIASGSKTWFDLIADSAELRPLTMPPASGDTLERYAERIDATGESGLHILITGSLSERHTISGSIHGADMGKARLRYAAKNGEVRDTENGVEFSVNTWRGPECPFDIEAWHEKLAEQNNAHINVPANLLSPLTISLTLDGAPAPASIVFVGKQLENRELNQAVLDPKAILARPELFDPISLPRRLAVYVWCVPPIDSISDANLDPDMANALKALGYL